MALILTKESPVFDLTKIAVGDFVRARHRTWKEDINGIAVHIDEERLQCIYLPQIHRATRYFTVRAQEVKGSEWSLACSHDLTAVEKVEMTNGYG